MTESNPTTMAIVDEIFAAFPGRFRFTSGYRTAAQNRAVNGVANSYHLTGQAADFVAKDGHYPPGEKEAIGRIVAKHGYEVLFYNAGSGVHYHIEPATGYEGPPTVTNTVGIGSVAGIALAVGMIVLVILITD